MSLRVLPVVFLSAAVCLLPVACDEAQDGGGPAGSPDVGGPALDLGPSDLSVAADVGPAVDGGAAADVSADTGSEQPDSAPTDAQQPPSDQGGGDTEALDGGPVLPPVVVPAGCNPLAASWDCLLPWPSDAFLTPDPALPSGRRLVVAEAALPRSPEGELIDLPARHPADGFSRLPAILALLPGPLDDSSLVFHTGDMGPSLLPASRTLLVRADTGVPVEHFAELDPRTPDLSRRALLLRPLAPLAPGTRYVVALQGVQRTDGQLVRAPEGFRRLRDQLPSGSPALEALAPHYEEHIFPVLEEFGVVRGGLQLAWDFTTRSQADAQGPLLTLRADLMQRMEQTPPVVAIDRVEEPVGEWILRRVHGTIEVPLYVSDETPGATLNRDEEGQIVARGVAHVPFLIQIPRSVYEGTAPVTPARLLQFGHGFFAGREESQGTFLRRQAAEAGFVVVAVDWWGMSHPDMPFIMETITTDPIQSFAFVERVHQAMANNLALGYALRTTIAALPEVQDAGGSLLYDPEQHYFYGISQGHILGGTLLALSPHLRRGVLSSGGCGFQFMMFRSRPFLGFLFVVSRAVPDPLDQQKFGALAQQALDPIDPITWAGQVLSDTLPGSPERRHVLMQVGLGDTSVPTLAAHVHARALGLALLRPAVRAVSGLADAPAPHAGSALVELDYGIEPPLPGDYAEPPVAENPVHEAIRQSPQVMEQIDRFLRPDGQIINPCDGACDPE